MVGAGLGALLAARAGRDPTTDRPALKASPRPEALVLLSPWGRSEAYRDFLAALDPRSVLLVAGSEEGAALATVKALAGRERSAGPRSLVVDGPGSHYDLAASRPDLAGTIAGFLADRLAPGGRTGG